MENLLLFSKENGIGRLIINRPDRLNAINSPLLCEMERLLGTLAEDTDIKVLIVTGAGDKSFVAGADIGEMSRMSPAQARAFAARGQAVFSALEALAFPVIAQVNGYALGGGCELALACDMRIASVNARMGQPEVGLGITAGFGGTQRLPRIIGRGKASLLLYTGGAFKAEEALAMGLVDKVVPHEQLAETCTKLAEKIAGQDGFAVRQTKACIRNGLEAGLSSGLSYESQAFGLCFSEAGQQSRMQAFIEKSAKKSS